MAKNLSGKVKVVPPSEVDADRYNYLELSQAEPNLGVPAQDGEVLASHADGTRYWTTVQGISQGVQGVQGTQGVQGGGASLQNIQDQIATALQGLQGSNLTNTDQLPEGIQNLYFTAQRVEAVIQGLQLTAGAQGAAGPQGLIGLQGITGSQGTIGLQGLTGSIGLQGITGAQGFTGLQGSNGAQGIIGLQGSIGAQGATGFQGLSGSNGLQGATGFQGLTGLQGIQGMHGAAAAQGIQGTQGIAGEATPVAFTYTQSSASTNWVINHNLGFYPNITVVDLSSNILEGDITYTDSNSVTLTFSRTTSGTAYLS